MGIEQAADRTHGFKLVSAELHLAHILEAAASVLTGKAPAEFERCVVERVMSRHRAPRVVRVRRVVMQGWAWILPSPACPKPMRRLP